MTPDYGAERRRLRVIKYRAQGFRGGYHDFVIRAGGAHVFPRLVAAEHRREFERERIGTGIAGLDTLARRRRRAGLEHPAARAGRRGQEHAHPAVRRRGDPRGRQGRDVHLRRGAGPAVRSRQAAGLRSRRPARRRAPASSRSSMRPNCRPANSPTTCATAVAGSGDVRTVVIDSLNGYQAAMPQENSLILHMHELLQFLQSPGRVDLPDRRPARAGGRHEGAGRRHLPRRFGDPAALLRGCGLGAARHLRHQEAHRQARGHDPRILDRPTACTSASRSSSSTACCAAYPSPARRSRAAPAGGATSEQAPPRNGRFAR